MAQMLEVARSQLAGKEGDIPMVKDKEIFLGFRKPIQVAAASLLVLSLVMSTRASAQSDRVSLAEVRGTLEPRSVWEHFYALTQVPRPSHHEERATALVAAFGRGLGLETNVDDAGNVIIRKPATPGLEGRPGVVLQAHLDMVPQKTTESALNFETDPISAVVEDGWVHAEGTTLGADDGIGVAIIMALLEASDVVHGPLEALFTVNEEDGFTGISALAPDALRGRTYINVDNELEGQFVTSSAGGANVEARAAYAQLAPPAGTIGLQVIVDGLIGGHSGADIDKGRASAHQLMARLLLSAPADFDLRLAELEGGDLRNGIPRHATVILVLPADRADGFASYVADFAATAKSELAATDPGVRVSVVPAAVPPQVMEAGAQQALLGAVGAVPQGVFQMSAEVPGLVETSGNLGVLRIRDGQFTASALVRSALDEERDAEARRFAEVFERAGASVTVEGAYAGWPPNPGSPLLALMQQIYTDLFGTAPTVTAVHAGLETSVAGSKYPGMDMISVGPTLQNPHSPDERLEVASVAKVYDFLVTTLRQIQ
jgi:dipeptidase D